MNKLYTTYRQENHLFELKLKTEHLTHSKWTFIALSYQTR